MAKYFLTDANGNKKGPYDEQQLQSGITRGIITPNTPLETDGGHKGLAGQIPGLKFNTAAPPHPLRDSCTALTAAIQFLNERSAVCHVA